MEDDTINTKGPSSSMPSPRPTYELLVQQSKKLGRVATKAIHGAQHILSREITLPRAEQILGSSFAHRQFSKKQHELEEAEKLKKVVKRSHEILGGANTVFPITLFPDSIIVDRTKISIIKREFFWTSNTISFQIEDVLNVTCGVGPIFGSLTIASRVMSTIDHFQINHLWRSDSVFLKHLIQGHIIAKQNKLETDRLTQQEMIDTLCELGMDADS